MKSFIKFFDDGYREDNHNTNGTIMLNVKARGKTMRMNKGMFEVSCVASLNTDGFEWKVLTNLFEDVLKNGDKIVESVRDHIFDNSLNDVGTGNIWLEVEVGNHFVDTNVINIDYDGNISFVVHPVTVDHEGNHNTNGTIMLNVKARG